MQIDFLASIPGQDLPSTQPTAEAGGADLLLDFIEGTLRPFVRSQFPNVSFTRDALYGHSLGAQFVVYALLRRPGLFDTYLAVSAGAGNWNSALISQWNEEEEKSGAQTKPALRLAYGALEARPVKRRTETEEAYQARAKFCASFGVGKNTIDLYHRLKGNSNLRDVEMKEYPWSDHASLGAVGLTDGIDYFVDW
ncbi:hypothetical protein N0V82_010433 [Gnomoniopsis sp. IMI 355080]|nr:hypothetical protein N0V82_010433 [Gnomoniopsis sp. IMI 355080]